MQEVRRMRQTGNRPHVQDLAHIADADAERLACETKRQVLRGFGHVAFPRPSRSLDDKAAPVGPRRLHARR